MIRKCQLHRIAQHACVKKHTGRIHSLIELDRQYAAQNYSPVPIVLNKGKGVFVYDVQNTKYIDFVSAYSSVNQGHCHPLLVQIMTEQCRKLTVCSRAFYNESMCRFVEYMHKTFGYNKCLPMNTGVEAAETALKLARLWGYKYRKIRQGSVEIIVAKNNFWGRSIAACSSSSDPLCYRNFGPFVPGFHFTEYNNTQQLEQLLQVYPNVAAVMLEPIQGEAGIIVPDDTYVIQVKRLCEKYRVLLICDEIQTGIGRTGKMLASVDYETNIYPDIVVLGKALSGGMMPISCVLANDNIFQYLKPGMHGSTFGGNPLACAIAPHAIDIIKNENLLTNAYEMGNLFRDRLYKYRDEGFIKDIRGKGLLNAIEFHTKPDADRFVKLLLEHKVLTKTTHDTVVRMCPPLIITCMQMNKVVDIIEFILFNHFRAHT